MSSLSLFDSDGGGFFSNAVSPLREAAAYEALWSEKGASFKRIADKFRNEEVLRPSDLVPESTVQTYIDKLQESFQIFRDKELGVSVFGTVEYPHKLRDAANPLELLYYQGSWDLINSPAVAIVGSRNPTDEGLRRARKLTQGLINDGYTIVSGLAEGIDTAAHEAALEFGGLTIGVIGTSLAHVYPKKSKELQEKIRKDFLLISQVPFMVYENQDYRSNRSFFPQRNITMSAITEATVIVEASDTSGTLYQARAALAQKRKLFILESCFQNPDITWPEKYIRKGAVRVKDYSDIRAVLDVHEVI